MESNVINIVCSERSEPKKKFIKNEIQLFLVVLCCVFLIIALGNYLYFHFGIPKAVVQLSMYTIVAVGSIYLYRHHLTEFEYILTERIFLVNRVIGKKEKPDVQLHVADILKIQSYNNLPDDIYKKKFRMYHGKVEDTLCIIYKEKDGKKLLMISASKDMEKALINQWKTIKR